MKLQLIWKSFPVSCIEGKLPSSADLLSLHDVPDNNSTETVYLCMAMFTLEVAIFKVQICLNWQYFLCVFVTLTLFLFHPPLCSPCRDGNGDVCNIGRSHYSGPDCGGVSR